MPHILAVCASWLPPGPVPSGLLQVLDHLEDHLKRSEYFRFLWFPHSENVSVIYQDPTNKAGAAGPEQEGRRGVWRRAQSCIPQHGHSRGSASPQHPPPKARSPSGTGFWILDFLALFPHGMEIWGGPGVPFSKPVLPSGVGKDAAPALMTIIIILCLALQPPSSSASWFWDYAIGYYLLEFLLWIR